MWSLAGWLIHSRELLAAYTKDEWTAPVLLLGTYYRKHVYMLTKTYRNSSICNRQKLETQVSISIGWISVIFRKNSQDSENCYTKLWFILAKGPSSEPKVTALAWSLVNVSEFVVCLWINSKALKWFFWIPEHQLYWKRTNRSSYNIMWKFKSLIIILGKKMNFASETCETIKCMNICNENPKRKREKG